MVMNSKNGLKNSKASERNYLPGKIAENLKTYPNYLDNTVFRARKQKEQGHYELRIEEKQEIYHVVYGSRNDRLGPLNIIEELETEDFGVIEEAERLLES